MAPAVKVAPGEVALLTIARALFGKDAYLAIESTLAAKREVTQLGPSAMGVLERTLARGVVKMLQALGGAATRRRPGHDRAVRVFEARRPPALAFGPYSFELLRWLTNAPLGARDGESSFGSTPATLGDQLLAYLVVRLVEGHRLERAVAGQPGLACGLTWLGFPRALARSGAAAPVTAEIAALVATEDGCTIVECLEHDLARRWAEPWPEDHVVPAELASAIVSAERAVLDAYVDAVSAAGRWDLASFVVAAGIRVLPAGVAPRAVAARVVPRVRSEGSLRSRSEARRRSGALFAALGRVGKKREELGLVRFIDDDYDTAQTLLASWEAFPREAEARAEGVLSVIASLEEL